MAIESMVMEVDPMTGVTRVMHWDHDTGDFVIEDIRDHSLLIEGAKALRADIDERARFKEGLTHVGFIPMDIMDEIAKLPSYEERQKAKADFLNDPAWSAFRTRPGRVTPGRA